MSVPVTEKVYVGIIEMMAEAFPNVLPSIRARAYRRAFTDLSLERIDLLSVAVKVVDGFTVELGLPKPDSEYVSTIYQGLIDIIFKNFPDVDVRTVQYRFQELSNTFINKEFSFESFTEAIVHAFTKKFE